LQRQLPAVTVELERSVSPALTDELGHLIRKAGTAPHTAAELRIEYASLLGGISGLVIGMLNELELADAGAVSLAPALPTAWAAELASRPLLRSGPWRLLPHPNSW
jgi:hypothetical protein